MKICFVHIPLHELQENIRFKAGSIGPTTGRANTEAFNQIFSCTVRPKERNNILQVASLAQLLPPRSPTVSNPVPDSSLCRGAAPRLCPLQLLLATCVPFESAAAPEPDCIASTAAVPRFASASSCTLRPLPAALPNCTRFSCCCTLAACVRFSCCS